MPAAQNTFDQLRGKIGDASIVIGQIVKLRKVVVCRLHEIHPVRPGLTADVGGKELLTLSIAVHTRHAGQTGRIPVGMVHGQAMILQEGIEKLYSAAVLRLIRGVDVYDSMGRLAGAVHQTGDGQLQLLVQCDLLLNGQLVGFHQRVAEIRDAGVLDTGAIQRIEADPCAQLGLPVANGSTQVIRVALQRGQQVLRSTIIHTAAGIPLAVLGLPHITGHIAYDLIRVEQRTDISG